MILEFEFLASSSIRHLWKTSRGVCGLSDDFVKGRNVAGVRAHSSANSQGMAKTHESIVSTETEDQRMTFRKRVRRRGIEGNITGL